MCSLKFRQTGVYTKVVTARRLWGDSFLKVTHGFDTLHLLLSCFPITKALNLFHLLTVDSYFLCYLPLLSAYPHTLCLSMLIFMLYVFEVRFNLSIIFCSPACVVTSIAWSSANPMAFISLPPTFTSSSSPPLPTVLAHSRYMLKKSGERRHPYFTSPWNN